MPKATTDCNFHAWRLIARTKTGGKAWICTQCLARTSTEPAK